MPPLSQSSLLPDFPQAAGARMMSIIDHKGPASYATLVTGSPPTGGDLLTAAECGLKFITAVSAQLSDDGQYLVDASSMAGGGAESTQVRLIWVTAATGAQVANATPLNARTIRLIVWGR